MENTFTFIVTVSVNHVDKTPFADIEDLRAHVFDDLIYNTSIADYFDDKDAEYTFSVVEVEVES